MITLLCASCCCNNYCWIPLNGFPVFRTTPINRACRTTALSCVPHWFFFRKAFLFFLLSSHRGSRTGVTSTDEYTKIAIAVCGPNYYPHYIGICFCKKTVSTCVIRHCILARWSHMRAFELYMIPYTHAQRDTMEEILADRMSHIYI